MPIKHIVVRPQWIVQAMDGEILPTILFPLLEAIQSNGKLTKAAKEVGVSYRHAWNLIELGHRFFGTPLVHLQRGQGARLTPVGEKLVGVEHRIKARLGPQFDSLTSELNHELAQLVSANLAPLRIHASHGFAVAKLPDLMAAGTSTPIDLRFMGSVEALASLQHGGCTFAGFHLPDGELGATAAKLYGPLLRSEDHRFVHLVKRVQGLYVAKGNPKRIQTLADLFQTGVSFANRQRGSGTRILLDQLLARHGLQGDKIRGYHSEEFTHAAVAAYVASGIADAGFGVEPPARQFGIDFIPLANETYYLACEIQSLTDAGGASLLELVRGPAFRHEVGKLPGYDATLSGKLMTAEDIMRSLRD